MGERSGGWRGGAVVGRRRRERRRREGGEHLDMFSEEVGRIVEEDGGSEAEGAELRIREWPRRESSDLLRSELDLLLLRTPLEHVDFVLHILFVV